jgi:hypothetical protein
MIFTICLLALSTGILMIAMGMALMIKNHEGLEKPSFLKKALCFFLVCLLTFLHMPLFDVIIRTIVSTYQDPLHDLAMQASRYIVSALAILAYASLLIFLVRIFNICVPTEMIPWCSPISNIAYLNLLIKAGLVVANAFDIEG